METTKIQWCHSTVNPVMGCDGCELWPGAGAVTAGIRSALRSESFGQVSAATLNSAFGNRPMSEIYSNRERIAQQLAGKDKRRALLVTDAIRHHAKCYAGLLGALRGGHKGYADKFERPKLFPGRMATAAKWSCPTAGDVASKPWLDGCPRLIFVSDMGDALSQGVSFDYLRHEIIDQFTSEHGRRHIWLWLTKRPTRMALFGAWLEKQQGTPWPENLMAMTTVTSESKMSRVEQLRRVPSRLRGLSLEPLFGPVELALEGIHWVIVGGGSDVLADAFHVEWALNIRQQCATAGVPFFFKQVGRNPHFQNQTVPLRDRHGGDWTEWPRAWHIREIPRAFREYGDRFCI